MNAGRALGLTWLLVLVMGGVAQVRSTGTWPDPKPLVSVSIVYTFLGILSEFAAPLALVIGIGLALGSAYSYFATSKLTPGSTSAQNKAQGATGPQGTAPHTA